MIKNDKKEEKEVERNQFCRIIESKQILKEFKVYLLNEISEPFNYIDLIDLLAEADADQHRIKIIINSPGGLLHTAIQLISGMRGCASQIITSIEGDAHSAASMIFLAGDVLEVAVGSSMLCHYYSGFNYGKGNEIKSAADFSDRHLRKFFKEVYLGFLTSEELERMFKGEDFWFDHEEIVKRLHVKRDLIIKTKAIAEEKEALAKEKHTDKKKKDL